MSKDRDLDFENSVFVGHLQRMASYYYMLKDYGRFIYYTQALQELSLDSEREEDFLAILKSNNKYKKITEDFCIDLNEKENYQSNKEKSLAKENPWILFGFLLDGRHPFLDIDKLKEETSKEKDARSLLVNIRKEYQELDHKSVEINEQLHEVYELLSPKQEKEWLDEPLGLFLIQTTFAGGVIDLEKTYKEFKDTSTKHLFIADLYESPNSFLGLNKERFLRQKKLLERLEIEHQIKTFKGLIIDLDEEGKPLAERDVLDCLDFVIIDIKTKPNKEVVKRLRTSTEHLKKLKNKIIINIFNRFSFLEDLNSLEDLIIKENLIISIRSSWFFNVDLFFDIFQSFNNSKIRVAFCGTKIDNRLRAVHHSIEGERASPTRRALISDTKLSVHKISTLFLQSNIINLNSRPFDLIQTKNIVSLKEEGDKVPLTSRGRSSHKKQVDKLVDALTSLDKKI